MELKKLQNIIFTYNDDRYPFAARMKPIGQYRYGGYGIWIVFRAVSVFDKWFIMAFMHYVLTFGFWPAFFLVKSFRHQGVTESWEVRPWEIMSCLQMDGGRKSSWGLSLVAHSTRMGKMDVVSTHWIAQYCTLPATCCIIMRTHIHVHLHFSITSWVSGGYGN